MKLRSITLEPSIQNCDPAASEETAGIPMTDETFADFYRSTARPFWTYLARVSGSDTLADDLAQESYLRFLCAKAPWQEGESACRRYLFRIGTNLLRDHWRRPSASSLENVPEHELPVIDPHDLEHLDSEALLKAGLAHLNPKERQLLWLAHAEGLSYREISAITGFSVPRIRLALFRSRHKLARCLRQEMVKSEVRK